jgi:hypothetical protein
MTINESLPVRDYIRGGATYLFQQEKTIQQERGDST